MAHLSVKADLTHDTILQWIAEGSVQPGQRLPSEVALAKRLGINARTVRRGLAELVREGIVVKQHRVGNFVSHPAASRFATGIGMMLPAYLFRVESHAAPAQILRAAGQTFDPRQFNLHILPYEKWRLWEDAGQLAVDKGLDGAILMPVSQVRRGHLRKLVQSGLKLVMLQPPEPLKGQGVGWIGVDRHALMRELLEGLVERGHRRLAILRYESDHGWSESRQAVDEVFAGHQLGEPDQAVVEIDNVDNIEQIHRILASRLAGADATTAVVVPDEIAANSVFQFCYARGIRVPDDLSIAALSNFAPWLNPVPLAAPDSVGVRLKMVAQAAGYLMRLIADESSPQTAREIKQWNEGVVLSESIQWNASVATIGMMRPTTGGPS